MPKPDDIIVPLKCSVCSTQCGAITFTAVPSDVDEDGNVLTWYMPDVDTDAVAAAYTSLCDIHS